MATARKRNERKRSVFKSHVADLRHKKGEAYTQGENRQALLSFYHFLNTHTTGSATKPLRQAAFEHTAEMLQRGERALHDVVKI